MRNISWIIPLSILFLSSSIVSVFPYNVYPKLRQIPVDGDPGTPLFLTPLIEAGNIDEARLLSRVGVLPGDGGVESYSGYFTVNKTYNSNLFFWFFPAEANYSESPLALWLQGGPGAPSVMGIFTESGPFIVNDGGQTLQRRNSSWTQTMSVLYIDNPIGTGFSFTEHDDGYANNLEDVATALYQALLQFFQMFPELQSNDFFAMGESFAGKMVSTTALRIHEENMAASLKINLKGIVIADGFTDPISLLNYGEFLYQLGLIDRNTEELFKAKENECAQLIQEEKWIEALDVFGQIINTDLFSYGSLFYNATGSTNNFNFLYNTVSPLGDFDIFVQLADIRRAIHVGNTSFYIGDKVMLHMHDSIMKSAKTLVEKLLENYVLLVYNGQMDIVVHYTGTASFLESLEWSGREEFHNVTRYQWYVGDELAGYVRSSGNLIEVLVRNAGHMVPTDQPSWAYDLVDRFVHNLMLPKIGYNKN